MQTVQSKKLILQRNKFFTREKREVTRNLCEAFKTFGEPEKAKIYIETRKGKIVNHKKKLKIKRIIKITRASVKWTTFFMRQQV